MQEENPISKNLRKGKYIIAITNAITAILFLIIYHYTKIDIVLYLAILLFLLVIGIIYYFSKLEKKYLNIGDNESNR